MGLFDRKKPEQIQEYRNGEVTETEERLLRALSTLRDAGILTREEYYEKKKKILEIN